MKSYGDEQIMFEFYFTSFTDRYILSSCLYRGERTSRKPVIKFSTDRPILQQPQSVFRVPPVTGHTRDFNNGAELRPLHIFCCGTRLFLRCVLSPAELHPGELYRQRQLLFHPRPALQQCYNSSCHVGDTTRVLFHQKV